MRFRELIFFARFLVTPIFHFSLGQNVDKVISVNPEIEDNNDKAKMKLDDLVIEVQPPPGRKNILNTRVAINQHWENFDNENFEDLPEMTSDTVSDKNVVKRRIKKSKRKRDIISGNDSQLEGKFSTNFGEDSLRKKLSDYKRSSSSLLRNYRKEIKPVAVQNNSLCRRKRSSENKAVISESVEDCAELENDDERGRVFENHFDKQNCPNKDLMAKNSAYRDIVEKYMRDGYDIALRLRDRARSLMAKNFCPLLKTASLLNSIQKQVQDLVSGYGESDLMDSERKFYRQHYNSLQVQDLVSGYGESDLMDSERKFYRQHYNSPQVQDLVSGYGESDLMDSERKFYRQHYNSPRCDLRAKYRSLDGSCNNIVHPSWGKTNTAFGRILPARYSDGIHRMPISVTNAELPNARRLSTKLIARGTKYDSDVTLAMMQWGQVLTHDLARQVIDRTTEGAIECCTDNGKNQLDESRQHRSCAPISISPIDTFYSQYGQRCMNFVRSKIVLRENNPAGPADQINAVTSFLDCSQVYGISRSESNELREFTGGRLKVEYRNGRWMLPIMKNHSDTCDIWKSDDFCYKSGDFRTCQNLQFVILHTLLIREHNRVADILSSLNPHWEDEKLFQEARRIVIAEYQHITYNEWLPLLLGKQNTTRNNFLRAENKLSEKYNENVDPSILIGFTTGAFRSLHSMIVGHVGMYNVNRNLVDVLRLDTHFYRPKVLEEDDHFAGLLRGLITQFGETQDANVNSQLTEYLFCSRKAFGKDLISLDIQRGRDHGVPSYNAYRKICHLRPAENFDDLSMEISWENIEKLRQEYAHVDDIDLIVGIYMENPLKGSRLGPTNRCIIAEQFYRSRVGDRFFYDNDNFPHSFTPEQFDEIKKVTLARLICDTENDVGIIQHRVFRSISRENSLVSCETLPKMDLSLWME